MEMVVFVVKSLGINGMNRVVLSQLSVMRKDFRCVVLYFKDKTPDWKDRFEALAEVYKIEGKGFKNLVKLVSFFAENRNSIRYVFLHDIPFALRILPAVCITGLLNRSFLYYHSLETLSKSKYLLLEKIFSPLVGRFFVSINAASVVFFRTGVSIPDGCVIINGIQPSLYDVVGYERSSFLSLVMLSRIKHSKGVERFLEVSKSLGRIFSPDSFKCILVGIAENRAVYEKLSQQLSVEMCQENVWKIVASSTAGFVASDREGMCLVPVEFSLYRRSCFLPKVSCYSGFYSSEEVLHYGLDDKNFCYCIALILLNPRLLLVKALNMRRLFFASYIADRMIASLKKSIRLG